MSSKSMQISALVAQLKAGVINKQELFERLQRLQAGGDAVRGPATTGSAAARRVRPPPRAAPNSRALLYLPHFTPS